MFTLPVILPAFLTFYYYMFIATICTLLIICCTDQLTYDEHLTLCE